MSQSKEMLDILPNVLIAIASVVNLIFVFFVFLSDKKTRERREEREINEFWFRKIAVDPVWKALQTVDNRIERICASLNLDTEEQVIITIRQLKQAIGNFKNVTRAGLKAINCSLQNEIQDRINILEDEITQIDLSVFNDGTDKDKFCFKIKESFEKTYTDILIILKDYEYKSLNIARK